MDDAASYSLSDTAAVVYSRGVNGAISPSSSPDARGGAVALLSGGRNALMGSGKFGISV
jgi:hypothetical protein